MLALALTAPAGAQQKAPAGFVSLKAEVPSIKVEMRYLTHHNFIDLPTLLRSGDLLVINDTRVFPARLIGRRLPGGGAAECFLIRPAGEPDTWIALVHPGQRLREGARMLFGGDATSAVLHAEIVGRHFHGRRTVRLWTDDGASVRDTIDAIGHVPLPPYIKRADATSDRDRYQTVYARHRGSIAAPTAGLHFTPEILEALGGKGVERASVTLHVGYGTFQPIRVDSVEQHEMEAEHYEVGPAAAALLTNAKSERRRYGRASLARRWRWSSAGDWAALVPTTAVCQPVCWPIRREE